MELMRIMVVDDDPVMRRLVQAVLAEDVYDVWTAASGEEALDLIGKKGLPHLAIVDLHMPPGMDGFVFCEKVLQYSDLPIILLTAEESEAVVVDGLDRFAEDYMVKQAGRPFRSEELKARVRTVLRRMADFRYTLAPVVAVDEHLRVDFAGRRAFAGGEAVSLTPTETKILYILMQHAGRTVPADYLLRRLWPMEEAYEERLHTHVYRLRKKIEPNPKAPSYVVSEWGRGYSFPAANASPMA